MTSVLYGPPGETRALQASSPPELVSNMVREVTDLAIDDRHFEDKEASKTQQYLQAAQISEQDVNDWASLPELPEQRFGMTQSVSNIYRSSFTILLQAWGCYPSDCIPENLRLATPYSLGLVVRLAELALLTRGCKDEAHATLHTVMRERISRMAPPPGMVIITGMARGMSHKRYLEHRIREYVGGVTIEDVETAKALCSIAPNPPRSTVPADSRADRAAKRLNRHQVMPPDLEAAVQHQDSPEETHVGDWGHGPQWANAQQKKQQEHHRKYQGNSDKQRLRRKQRRRNEVLELRARLQDEEANGERMQGDSPQVQAKESMRAPASSQLEEGLWEGQMAKRPKKPKPAKTRNIRLDRRMARVFDRVNVDQPKLPDGEYRHSIDDAAFQNESAPQQRIEQALPSEQSAVWLSPLGSHHRC